MNEVCRWEFDLWTTQATILSLDAPLSEMTKSLIIDELNLIELTCSRFREDSEVRRLESKVGKNVLVSRRLRELLGRASDARELTLGAVDVVLPRMNFAATDGPRWARSGFDEAVGTYTPSFATYLDFGSIGKAYAADTIASLLTHWVGAGVLVNFGGDICIAGAVPNGGWNVAIEDGTDRRESVVSLRSGALATSSTRKRTRIDALGESQHHIMDPRTGLTPTSSWTDVSVVAGDCVSANAYATGAIVMGSAAPDFLAQRRVAARLVADDGQVCCVGGWPAESQAA